jgi:L-alanine-DL-glutamate epimerase-like enolase superfamily enzyme
MSDRPAVLIRVEDGQGAHGWGEVWCNFPTCGAEHRTRLVETVVAPLIIGRSLAKPDDGLTWMEDRTGILAVQTAEYGPLAQAIAGMDIAIWDLAARRAGKPLHKFLGGTGPGAMPAYASGINPDAPMDTVQSSRNRGFRAFKLKIGFDSDRDTANIKEISRGLGKDEQLMVDANQAWDLSTAKEMSRRLSEYGLSWLEEPIRADRPIEEWADLAAASPIPLAAGENIRGQGDFQTVIESGNIQVIQPDACKWGGITGCLTVARNVLAAGRRYCPHYLGGGIGLLASAHILAAVGGDGLLEADINLNPLREGLAEPFPHLENGQFILSDAPGLGVEPDFSKVDQFIVMRREVS